MSAFPPPQGFPQAITNGSVHLHHRSPRNSRDLRVECTFLGKLEGVTGTLGMQAKSPDKQEDLIRVNAQPKSEQRDVGSLLTSSPSQRRVILSSFSIAIRNLYRVQTAPPARQGRRLGNQSAICYRWWLFGTRPRSHSAGQPANRLQHE